MKRLGQAVLAALMVAGLFAVVAPAQVPGGGGATVVSACGSKSLAPGSTSQGFIDATGNICSSTSGGGGGGGPATLAAGAVAAGAYVAGSVLDGAIVTLGALADAACATDNGTCSTEALIKRTNQRLTSLIALITNPLPVSGTVAATQSGTWTVQPGNTANTTAWLVNPQPAPVASGGLSAYFLQPTASDNHAVIKNGAGQVYRIVATNNSATINYLRLYDAGTGFNGCNSATNLITQIAIPASTSGAGFVDNNPMGTAFATGISICVTSGYATTDTTNATASAMSVSVGYK